MAMAALGREFDVVPTADAVEVNMRDYGGVTFICVGADTYTIAECTSAAGAGAQTLAAITKYYTNTGAVGATAWVEVVQAAGGAIVVAANAALYVDSKQLSEGFTYLRCTSTATGLVIAILHDPQVQRAPQRLVAAAL